MDGGIFGENVTKLKADKVENIFERVQICINVKSKGLRATKIKDEFNLGLPYFRNFKVC